MKATRNKGDFIAPLIGLADINVALWIVKGSRMSPCLVSSQCGMATPWKRESKRNGI